MNKLFLSAVLFLGLSITAFGQEKSKSAISKGKVEVVNSKSNGIYHFTLPKGTTAEAVKKNAEYYKIYFSVSYVESTQDATITMLINDEKSRHVICRFMSASQVDTVQVDGKDYTLEDFYVIFLR